MMATIRQLHVYLDGVLIGEARQSPQGALSFVYDDTYRADAEATPLSLSMPLASAKHRNKQVRAYLEVCPDSEAARARLGPGVQRLRQQLLRAPGSRRTRRRGRSPGAPAGRRNQRRAFKALAFNVLIGGTDAYAKNYSLLLIGPRAQTAPLYDVASAACYPQRQRLSSPIKIGDHWKMLDVNARDWSTVAQGSASRPTAPSSGSRNFAPASPAPSREPSRHCPPTSVPAPTAWPTASSSTSKERGDPTSTATPRSC